MLRPRFQLTAVFIFAFWAVMMALLVRREVIIPRLAAESFHAASVPGIPRESFMGIYLSDGRKIGYLHTYSTPDIREGEEGARLGLSMTLRTRMLGKMTSIRVRGDAWASAIDGIRELDFSVRSGDHEAELNAAIEDGVIKGVVNAAGESVPIQFPVDKDLVLWSGMGASNIYFPAMEEGDAFLIDAFDPVTMSKSAVLVRCVGTEDLTIGSTTYLAKVVDMEFDTITTRAHIDATTGDVLRAETPMGIVLQRIEQDEATIGMADDEAADLLDLATITPLGLKPFSGAKRMVVRMTSPNDSFAIPADDIQRIQDGDANVFAIEMMDTPVQHSADPALLTPDRSMQSDHPTIRNRAAEIVEGAQNDWERVERIAQWVAQNVAPSQTLSVPAALEVLEKRSGGPNEMAVLFAGLAQAAGIPSRIAVGVVWDDTLERFHYHAWPEVFLGNWYWIDPQRNQSLADATHIKLSDEGVETWTQTLFTISTIQIEVLEVE